MIEIDYRKGDNMSESKFFQKRLIKLMEEHDMNKNQLAKKSGLSYSVIYGYVEKGS